MVFKLWSELNNTAKAQLKPDFGYRAWNILSKDEKYKVWKYLDVHFFDRSSKGRDGYEFYGDYSEKGKRQERILIAIHTLNDAYKARSYAKKFLESSDIDNACEDFFQIFIEEDENVVFELLSFYAKVAIEKGYWNYIYRKENETDEEFKKRSEEWEFIPFDHFAQDLNEVLGQFGINLHLTRSGFVPRQEEKIIKEVYEPVLKVFSHAQWKEVNQLLADSFAEYRKNSKEGYSNSVTNSVAAIQAFLQIIVNGKTGNGDISKLIPQAQSKGLIPSDSFTKEVFSKIEGVLMRERQETGVAHPKKEYATESNALLVLNLCMVFFQHCIGELR